MAWMQVWRPAAGGPPSSWPLEDDASQGDSDRYDRLLRYVWSSDGTMLNERLVAEGYGREDTYDDAYRYRDRFVAAEASAEASRVGLWAACG